MSDNSCLLSIAYFPPIQYISKFLLFDDVLIEKYENFSKQSYRNRCNILSANGPLTLSIPTKKEEELKVKITDIRIDYDTDWQKLHLKGIESAYRHSPFYEHYIDYFLHFFENEHKFLFEFNIEILNVLLELFMINTNLSYTSKFVTNIEDISDYRDSIHPKKRMQKNDSNFKLIEYNQVFSNKFDFSPNLSSLDLLFNEGPNAISIINQSIIY